MLAAMVPLGRLTSPLVLESSQYSLVESFELLFNVGARLGCAEIGAALTSRSIAVHIVNRERMTRFGEVDTQTTTNYAHFSMLSNLSVWSLR